MNFLDTFKENQTPVYRLYLEPGIHFIPGSNSHEKIDSLTVKGDCKDFSVSPNNIELYKAEIQNDDYNLEPSVQDISIIFYRYNSGTWTQVGYETDPQTIKDGDNFTFTVVEDSGSESAITVQLKTNNDSEYTQGDQWIFSGRERLDITPYLHSCNQISFQGQDEYFKGTYLGNSLQFSLLKGLDIAGFEDNSFDPDTTNNIFHKFGWGIEGYRSKFTLYTGFIEGSIEDLEVSFIGFLEDIKSHRDIISVNVGDGLYIAKETNGDNIGKIIHKSNLRSSRETDLAYTQEIETYEQVSFKHDKKYDVIQKPLSKNYPKEKLLYKPTGEASENEIEAEIVGVINYTGTVKYGQATINHDNGIIEFDVSPLERSDGEVLYTYKHCYRYKSPSFLSRKLFERLGYETDSSNFKTSLMTANEEVFTSFGRITEGVEDYRKDYPSSMSYSEHRKEFYFGIGTKIVSAEFGEGTSDIEKVLVDLKDFDPLGSGDKIRKIYKLFCFDDSTSISNSNTFVVALCLAGKSEDGLLENEFGKFLGKTLIIRILINDTLPTLSNPTTNTDNVWRIFETPDNYSAIMFQNYFGNNQNVHRYIVRNHYAIMGSPQNKDYANGSFLKTTEDSSGNVTAHLYFNFQFHTVMCNFGRMNSLLVSNWYDAEGRFGGGLGRGLGTTHAYRVFNYLYKISLEHDDITDNTNYGAGIKFDSGSYQLSDVERTGGITTVKIGLTEEIGLGAGDHEVLVAGTGLWDGVKKITVADSTDPFIEVASPVITGTSEGGEGIGEFYNLDLTSAGSDIGTNPQVLRHGLLSQGEYPFCQSRKYSPSGGIIASQFIDETIKLGIHKTTDSHTDTTPVTKGAAEGAGNFWRVASGGGFIDASDISTESLYPDSSAKILRRLHLVQKQSSRTNLPPLIKETEGYFANYGDKHLGVRTDLSDFYISDNYAYLLDVVGGNGFLLSTSAINLGTHPDTYGDPETSQATDNTLYLRIRKYALDSTSGDLTGNYPLYTIVRRFQNLVKYNDNDKTLFIYPDKNDAPVYTGGLAVTKPELDSVTPFIPLDIWGICCNEINSTNDFYTFCVHWIPTHYQEEIKEKHNVAGYKFDTQRDFKTICCLHVNYTDTDERKLKWSGMPISYKNTSYRSVGTHNDTEVSMTDLTPQHKVTSTEVDKNKDYRTPHFFVQTNLVEGTDRYKIKTDWHLTHTVDKKDNDSLPQLNYFNKLNKGDIQIVDPEMMSAEIKGNGELAVMPKFPFIYKNEIVYLGGNFGKYSTNSDLANEFSSSKNISVIVKDKYTTITPTGFIQYKTPHTNFLYRAKGYSENSHGRLISFSFDSSNPISTDALNIMNFKWKYLGYSNGNHPQNIYKDFVTPVVFDSNMDFHFIVGRSYRNASVSLQVNPAGKAWSSAYLNVRGSWATHKELDLTILEDLENFNWIQYSKNLATVVPLANFNDVSVFNVLSNLAKVQDYEFGINNETPYFRPKSEHLAAEESSWTISKISIEKWRADGGTDATNNPGSSGSGNEKYWIINKEIFQTLGNSTVGGESNTHYHINRGLFGTEKTAHFLRSKIYELRFLANDDNIINISDSTMKYHNIYNRVLLNYTYDSYSLKESMGYQISKESMSQQTFKRDLVVDLQYINNRYVADFVANRYRSIATQNRKETQLRIKFSPFLRNGDIIAINNNKYNLDFDRHRISRVNHNLKEYVTDVVAIQELNPATTINTSLE